MIKIREILLNDQELLDKKLNKDIIDIKKN